MARTYLVIVNEAPETKVALRFAARRAARTDAEVEILTIVEPQAFVQWGGVQAAMEEEEQMRAEANIAASVGEIVEALGIKPVITVKQGKPIDVIEKLIEEREDIAALVLGAASSGNPGPIVTHFTGEGSGQLPCPVLVIPGSLSDERIEALS